VSADSFLSRPTPIARRDWWIGIGTVAFAILVHAFLPRFSPPSNDAAIANAAADAAPGAAPKSGTFRLADVDRPAVSREADASSLAGVGAEPGSPVGPADQREGIPTTAEMSPLPAVGGEGQPASLGPVGVACTIIQAVRQTSGEESDRRSRKGLGRLRIKNATASDTVAVLVSDADGAPQRAMLIRAREVGVIASVPSGRYRLRFQQSAGALQRSGSGRLREGRVCRRPGASTSDEPFDFFEIEADVATQYVSYDVTLHPGVRTTRVEAPADSTLEVPTR
jgi:hypothetical protein